jgi:hypothetical protein
VKTVFLKQILISQKQIAFNAHFAQVFFKTFNIIAKICHQTKINDEECNVNYTS